MIIFSFLFRGFVHFIITFSSSHFVFFKKFPLLTLSFYIFLYSLINFLLLPLKRRKQVPFISKYVPKILINSNITVIYIFQNFLRTPFLSIFSWSYLEISNNKTDILRNCIFHPKVACIPHLTKPYTKVLIFLFTFLQFYFFGQPGQQSPQFCLVFFFYWLL